MLRRSSNPATKRRAKSGCKTCRKRKVRCDEGWPSCYRCTSTDLVCEGYGIWGGGSNTNIDAGRRGPSYNPPAPIGTIDINEQSCLEWFFHRSALKLPGVFVSSFWENLMVQTGLSEPAVLHAILALSSVHKKDMLVIQRQKADSVPDEYERFTLQQYSRATSYLIPHLSTNNKDSIRVALTTCLIFAYVESIRGYHKRGIIHLQNGVRLLKEIQGYPKAAGRNASTLILSMGSVENSISEAIARLYLQAKLFGLRPGDSRLLLRVPASEDSTLMFQTILQARQHLDRLLLEIFNLAEQCNDQAVAENASYSCRFSDIQRGLEAELWSWYRAYELLKSNPHTQKNPRDAYAFRILRIYLSMANIMIGTCLVPKFELIFDSYTNEFVSIITQSIDLRKHSLANTLYTNMPEHHVEHPTSVSDMGWIAPLYYTAVKCRVHRLRAQAIKLISSTMHKEGMWDATLAACIAQQVMEIEEGDFYQHIGTVDNFDLYDKPDEGDFLLPTLPGSHRIHLLQVALPNFPTENMGLMCKRINENGGSEEVIVKEYDARSQRWKNVSSRSNSQISATFASSGRNDYLYNGVCST